MKIKTDYPPYLHNLLRLGEKADLEINDILREQLAITAFNINARYDDFYSWNPFVVEIRKTGYELIEEVV